ncbi:MAG: Gfo/Idh/MocA family oxidoreductase, partial [Planctomycetaceae bacterium]|nr:Gfo/Idh/MocA family oxidoreductase [Planctomycetaceae bacterium]
MSDSVNRRTFLGQSAAAATVASFAAPAILSAANNAPSKKVTIGIMGMQRGLALAKTFGALDGVEIKYVCDTDDSRAANAAKTVEKATSKAPQAIGDFRKILDDKEVDALIVAAPNHWHSPATILGCSAGKNVYVEKPCSHNPKEGEMMVAAARKNKKAVQMGSQRRSSESI